MGKWNSRRTILAILGAAAIAVASGAITHEILEWRGRAVDEACFAAPEPECLLDAAERIAGVLEENQRRAKALLSVARGRGRIGDMDGMRRLMEPATEAALADAQANEPDLSWPDQTLMARIVTGWEEAGDRGRALELANEPGHKVTRDGRREALIGHLARRGDFEGALAVASGFEDSLTTARLLADILQAALAKGAAPELDPALARIATIADGLADEAEQREARALIGQIQALAGRTEEALATADALGHDYSHDWIIQNAVLERTRRGEIDGALAVAERIVDPSQAVSALWYAAQSLDSPGGRDAAMILLNRAGEIAETIPDDKERNFRSFWIRNSRVKFLDTDEALPIIAAIDDAQVRDRMYWTRASQLAEAGDPARALEVAEMIGQGIERTLALSHVAKAAAAARDDELARRIYRMMISDATDREEDYLRSSALGTVAAYQIEEGYLDDARATLGLMDDGFGKDSTAHLVAVALAENGDIEGALEMVMWLSPDYYDRETVRNRVASVMAQAGDVEGAVSFLRENGGRGIGYMLVQMASPEEIEIDREWRAQDVAFYEPPTPPPAKPAGWDDCLVDPTNECMLTLAQALADRDGAWPGIHMQAAAGWAAAGRLDKAREALEMAETHAWRSYEELYSTASFSHGGEQIWEDIAMGWVNLGDWKRAEALAESVPDEHRWYMQFSLSPLYQAVGNLEASLAWALKMDASAGRCYRIQLVGKAYWNAGDAEAARRVLALLAREVAEVPDNDIRMPCKTDLGDLQIALGMLDDALDTASGLARDRDRELLVRAVAYKQAEDGDMETALQTLAAVEDPVSLIAGYRGLARIAFEAGDRERIDSLIAEAFARSRALPFGEDRDRAFRGNAFFLARQGEYDAASGWIAEINGPKLRAETFRDIARILAEAGERDRTALVLRQAIDAASEIPERSERDMVLNWIASDQAEAGLFDDALKSAELMETSYERERLYAAVAKQQARAGDVAAALETAETLEDEDDLNGALAGIAVQMARAGDLPGAMTLLERIGPNWVSAEALVRIASPDEPDW